MRDGDTVLYRLPCHWAAPFSPLCGRQATRLSLKAAALSGRVQNALSGSGHVAPPFRAARRSLTSSEARTERGVQLALLPGPCFPLRSAGAPGQGQAGSPAFVSGVAHRVRCLGTC